MHTNQNVFCFLLFSTIFFVSAFCLLIHKPQKIKAKTIRGMVNGLHEYPFQFRLKLSYTFVWQKKNRIWMAACVAVSHDSSPSNCVWNSLEIITSLSILLFFFFISLHLLLSLFHSVFFFFSFSCILCLVNLLSQVIIC